MMLLGSPPITDSCTYADPMALKVSFTNGVGTKSAAVHKISAAFFYRLMLSGRGSGTVIKIALQQARLVERAVRN
jgi:hypothetical protein